MTVSEFNEMLVKLNKDSSAKKLLVSEYYGIMKNHIFGKFGKHYWCEDILHDVFDKLFETDWSGFKGVRNPVAWLYKICDNKVYESLKKMKRECPLTMDMISTFDLDYLFIRVEARSFLRKFTPEMQKILYFRYWLGFTYSEIAATMKISTVTLRVRVYRAMAQVRERYRAKEKLENSRSKQER